MNELSGVPQFLRELVERTAEELWKVARGETTTTRLVLPRYRNGAHRVSEQEARSIAQQLVADSAYYFSVETPTDGLYKFTGKEHTAARSASHDMTLYLSPEPRLVAAHIEFKQGHRSGEAGVHTIAKDLTKLVGSGRHSLWFHSFPLPTENEFRMLRSFFVPVFEEATANGMSLETEFVLAFCAVVEPVAWIAGPIAWSEVKAVFEAFPVVDAVVHSASRYSPEIGSAGPSVPVRFED